MLILSLKLKIKSIFNFLKYKLYVKKSLFIVNFNYLE